MSYTPVAVNLGAKKKVLHYIYLRKHQKAEQSAVFVSGLPHDTTIDNIKDLCSALGSVLLERFEYQGNNRGLVHLVDDAACERLLKKAKSKQVPWGLYGPRGAAGYAHRQQLRFPDEQELLRGVDEYMEAFAELEQQQKAERERASTQVDADGFQLVVNTKRKMDEAPTGPRKKKSHEKSDFYRFQLRETRKQEMNDLLKRYQEDKAKVEELQRKRSLNPYS